MPDLPTDRFPALPDTSFRTGDVLGVWAAAAVTYGFGDTLTTVVAVWHGTAAVEANPVVASAISVGGLPGLVLLKIAAFLACLGIALDAARRADRLGFYAPPAVLAVLGAFASTTNLLLLVG